MIEDSNMCWLPHLPAGWQALYRQFLTDLAATGISAEVTEAKEKFGTLRLSLAHHERDAARHIRAATPDRLRPIPN